MGVLGKVRIDDPRDNLDKAVRWELDQFAKENGVTEITPEMPAILKRKILRSKGLVNIKIPTRVLGQPRDWGTGKGALTSDPNALVGDRLPPVDTTTDLARQWEAFKAQEAKEALGVVPPRGFNKRRELAKECKARGIVIARTDKVPDLERRLAEHGAKQNPA